MALGGSVEIDSSPGAGARLSVSLPLPPVPAATEGAAA
jgi:chemotaxis protein histidine kinase CheA